MAESPYRKSPGASEPPVPPDVEAIATRAREIADLVTKGFANTSQAIVVIEAEDDLDELALESREGRAAIWLALKGIRMSPLPKDPGTRARVEFMREIVFTDGIFAPPENSTPYETQLSLAFEDAHLAKLDKELAEKRLEDAKGKLALLEPPNSRRRKGETK